MQKITQSITLDLIEIQHNVVNAHEGDKLVRNLDITITDKGCPYPIPNGSFTYLRGKRADGRSVFYNIAEISDSEGGKIRVDIHDYLLSSAGRCRLDIAIYNTPQKLYDGTETTEGEDHAGTEIASTESFVLYIPDGVFDEKDIVDSDEGSTLATLINSARGKLDEMTEVTDQMDQMQTLVNTNKPIWDDKYTKNEVDNKFSTLETNIDWKESVDTYADIATTYPSPQDGWTVNIKDTDYTYRWNGSEWVTISANAIPKATSEIDGLLSKEDKSKLDRIDPDTENIHTHTISQITDFPSSMKNPSSLTISLNGTSQGNYDGSMAKTINITASSIGAANSLHDHDNDYLLLSSGGTVNGHVNVYDGLTINEGDVNIHDNLSVSGSIIGGKWKYSDTSNYGLYWSSTNTLRPTAASSKPNIGTSSYPLNNVYATALYESGTSLINKYQKKIGWVDQQYTRTIGQGDNYTLSATTDWNSSYTCIGYNIMKAWPASTWTGAAVSVAKVDLTATWPTIWLTAATTQTYDVIVRFFYIS